MDPSGEAAASGTDRESVPGAVWGWGGAEGAGAGAVRRMTRPAARPCARPECPAGAAATLAFSYPHRRAVLDDLAETPEPAAYDLCPAHADRTVPPRGWEFDDRRATVTATRDDEESATIAVLARAMRADAGSGGG